MDREVGNLKVRLTAETDEFEAALDRAIAKLERVIELGSIAQHTLNLSPEQREKLIKQFKENYEDGKFSGWL